MHSLFPNVDEFAAIGRKDTVTQADRDAARAILEQRSDDAPRTAFRALSR